MTVVLANALRKGFFAYTNSEKGHNSSRSDHTERAAVSNLQTFSAAGETVDLAKGTKVGANLADTLKSTKTTSTLFKYVSKAANLASDMVNPLLIVASAARVYSADDKKSSTIQEGSAMGAMFLAEGQVKKLLGLKKGSVPTYTDSKFLTSVADGIKNFCTNNKVLSKLPTNKIAGVLKAITFVTASCAAFAAGGHIGKYIADNTTARSYQKAQLAKANKEYNQTKNITKNTQNSSTMDVIS